MHRYNATLIYILLDLFQRNCCRLQIKPYMLMYIITSLKKVILMLLLFVCLFARLCKKYLDNFKQICWKGVRILG